MIIHTAPHQYASPSMANDLIYLSLRGMLIKCWNSCGDLARKTYTLEGLQFAPTKNGMASIVVALTLCLATVGSHADEPKDDHEPPKAVKPEGNAPPKAEQGPVGKELTATTPKKTASSTTIVDTYDPDVPANMQSNRLKRMHSIIELHLNKAERKVFEENEINYPNGNQREQFYKSVCDDLEITC
jgi:hypothetical protein